MKLVELYAKTASLVEARSAPLYHATSYESAIKILQTNQIKSKTMHLNHLHLYSTGKKIEQKGVSLTRDFNFAKNFPDKEGAKVIFVLDQQKLAQRYKIKPVDYFFDAEDDFDQGVDAMRRDPNMGTAEAEEFLFGPITNVGNYITAILVDKNQYVKVQNNQIKIGLKKLFDLLANNPKLKVIDFGGHTQLKKAVGEDDEHLTKKEISRQQLKQIEDRLDQLFRKVGLDVKFSQHFSDRINHLRNEKQITVTEIISMFVEFYKKYGQEVASHAPEFQAVISDISTLLNVPFVLQWDKKNKEMDVLAKTIMRKPDFTTSNPVFKVDTKIV
jgi:hypothetical protein